MEGKFIRDKDFELDGVYSLTVNGIKHKVYRDTSQFGYGVWYELIEGLKYKGHQGETDGSKFLGYTKKEVLNLLKGVWTMKLYEILFLSTVVFGCLVSVFYFVIQMIKPEFGEIIIAFNKLF